jgi:hypothetical protein
MMLGRMRRAEMAEKAQHAPERLRWLWPSSWIRMLRKGTVRRGHADLWKQAKRG